MKKVLILAVMLLMITSVVSASTTDNIYASKISIQTLTGRQITDFWVMEYGESLTADKSMIMTKGAVELNNDGVKRLFWCHFNAQNLTLLRLKIDGQVLFSTLGW